MSALLDVDALETCYGSSQALFGMGFSVQPREAVTLIGRNGMGKSTTVKSVMGWVAAQAGSVRFGGREIRGHAPHKVAQAGIGLVPEGRHVFANLSVRENLVATAADRRRTAQPWTLDRVYALFPRLREREHHLGAHLSGGEQQMLAIGRALMTNPLLLILDEATEGLAPLIRLDIWRAVETLKAEGMALVLIDKNIAPLLRLADRHFVVEKGRVVWSGSSHELRAAPEVLHRYVGV